MIVISALLAATAFAATIAAYLRTSPSIPPRDRLALIRWLMAWPLIVLVICAGPSLRVVSTLLHALGT